MQYPDYYKVLGVAKTATPDEIKKAYRRLARKYHPDVSKEADPAARMAEINEANEVLSDPKKRAAYDAVGHEAWAQGARSAEDVRPPYGQQGFDPRAGQADGFYRSSSGAQHSDFFEELFGQAARARAGQGHAGGGTFNWPGEDQHADITLSLAEAYHGAERTLQLQSVGVDEHGQVIPRMRTLNVNIPAGVAQGQLIRLGGQGGPGQGSGAAGDLFLKVHIEPGAASYHVDGRDVTMKVFVAPWEAALGADIQTSTPAGTLTVTVPAGSVSGRKLRLRGKGIPGKQAGDLFLELDIAVPSAVTDAQKEAWESLSKAYPGFKARGPN